MAYVTDEIQNLIQGVSQQAPASRRPTQSQRELNTMQSAVDGLGDRPPFEWVNNLTGHLNSDDLPFVHWINRDRQSQFAVTCDGDTLDVYRLSDGVNVATFPLTPSHPLYAPGAGDFRKQYVAHTVADTTFIANRAVKPAVGANTHPTRPFEAIINFKDISFSQKISIRVDGVLYFDFLVPNGSAVDHGLQTSTELIASYAVEAPNIAIGGTDTDNGNMGPGLDTLPSPFTVIRDGSLVYITNPNTDFEIAVDDANANRSIDVVKSSVNRFSDLPANAPVHGFMIQIVGDDRNDFDDYFVAWDDTDKVWKEAPEPGSRLGLDPETMPYVLQQQPDLSWTLQPGTWGTRDAGSNSSNEDPPFVGQPISAISHNNGRLAIAAGEDLFWSKVGDVFQFYRETVTTFLDDDPFGIVASGQGETVSEIRAVVAFSRRIITVSDSHQNIISRRGAFGKSGVEVDPGPAIAVSPFVSPLVLNSDFILATDRGQFSGISQMFVDNVTEVTEDEDVTEHVPKYIPKDLHTFTGSKTETMVFAASSETPESLYVWRYILQGRRRPQSSFTTWAVPGTIVSAQCIGSLIYVIALNFGSMSLMVANLSPSVVDPGQDFRTLLDIRHTEADCTLTYDPVSDTTEVVTPFPWLSDVSVVSRTGSPPDPETGEEAVIGALAGLVNQIPGSFELEGDWTARKFYVGKRFSTEYEFSPLFVRNRDQVAVQSGRLQVTRLLLDYDRASYFQVEIDSDGTRPARFLTFEGRIVDSPSNVTDKVALASGQLSVPVMGRGDRTTITIRNDSHLPANFIKAEWEGQFKREARPV